MNDSGLPPGEPEWWTTMAFHREWSSSMLGIDAGCSPCTEAATGPPRRSPPVRSNPPAANVIAVPKAAQTMRVRRASRRRCDDFDLLK